ncbi:hypothetical protein J2S53_003365 [Actinopolyspora lacussalsi]|nr:hypothetical protein [Actinopolyspora lacussalsi]
MAPPPPSQEFHNHLHPSLTSEALQKRMNAPEGSLHAAAEDIRDKLNEKIAAYEALLREYDIAEDNASVAQRDTERQS